MRASACSSDKAAIPLPGDGPYSSDMPSPQLYGDNSPLYMGTRRQNAAATRDAEAGKEDTGMRETLGDRAAWRFGSPETVVWRGEGIWPSFSAAVFL